MNTNLIKILKKYKEYRYLTISTVVTGLSTWGAFIAMLVLLDEITENGVQLGILWATSGLLPLFISFYLGVIVDKIDRRKIIIFTEIFRSLLFLLFILVPILPTASSWILFIIIRLFSGICNQLNIISKQSIIPDIISDEKDLVSANSFNYTISSSIRLLGAAGGGALVAILNLNLFWILAALSFLVSAILFYRINITADVHIKEKSLKKQIQAMLKVSKSNIQVRFILFFALTGGLIIGAFNLMIQQMSFYIYDTGSWGVSLLYISEGIVSVILGIWIANKASLFKQNYRYGFFYILSSLMWILFGLTTNLFLGMFLLGLFAGFGSFVVPYERQVMQTSIDASMRGRIFGFWNTISTFSIQIGALITGFIIEYLGINFVSIISGSFDLILGLVFLVYMYKYRDKFNLRKYKDKLEKNNS